MHGNGEVRVGPTSFKLEVAGGVEAEVADSLPVFLEQLPGVSGVKDVECYRLGNSGLSLTFSCSVRVDSDKLAGLDVFQSVVRSLVKEFVDREHGKLRRIHEDLSKRRP